MTIKPIKTKKDYQAAMQRLEVIFDAAPPKMKSVSLLPDRVILLGKDLEVRAVCSDALLSGMLPLQQNVHRILASADLV